MTTPVLADPPARAEPAGETAERLLDAAEQLFAARGFDGTSLRAVTRAAGTSVSAANYHFGSKEALLREVLRRRIEPVNRRRIEGLDALEARWAEGSAPGLEAVLEAFFRPVFEESATRPEAVAQLRQVTARLFADPPERVDALKRELFGPLAERFVHALHRTLPDRAPAQVAVGFHFCVGMMVHILSGHLRGSPPFSGIQGGLLNEEPSGEELLDQMIRFAAAGLRAHGAPDPRAPGEETP